MSQPVSSLQFWGIDGCPGGWVMVSLNQPATKFDCRFATTLAELFKAKLPALALIDMPIGLPSKATGDRVCDAEARRLLGSRASTLFSPPARAALKRKSFEEALSENRRSLGVGISKQAWNLKTKLLEVDGLVRRSSRVRKVLRESHPELCFLGAGAHGIGSLPSKHKRQGLELRRRLLGLVLGKWAFSRLNQQLTAASSKRYQANDLLDAAILAWAASRIYRFPAGEISLPGKETQRDAHRIEMSIGFWAFSPELFT